MENGRPSLLRGDIRPRPDRVFPGRGEFTSGEGPPQDGFAILLFVLRRGPVLPYLKVVVVSAPKIFWMIWM